MSQVLLKNTKIKDRIEPKRGRKGMLTYEVYQLRRKDRQLILREVFADGTLSTAQVAMFVSDARRDYRLVKAADVKPPAPAPLTGEQKSNVRAAKRISAALTASAPAADGKAMCRAGLHEMVPENLIQWSAGKRCKECYKIARADQKARREAVA